MTLELGGCDGLESGRWRIVSLVWGFFGGVCNRMTKLPRQIEHLVGFSGGVTSWATAKLVVKKHGKEGVVLLFADTLIEDPTLYAFLEEAALNVGAPLVKISDGRTPHEVFKQERFMGNARVDPCSKHLKRNLLDKWREDNCEVDVTTYHVGLDWTEPHRLKKLAERISPWKCEALLTKPPYLEKQEVVDWAKAEGLTPCSLYGEGFPHANCGGTCCKAGIAHWTLLYKTHPGRFAEWESTERWMMENVSEKCYMLRDRRGGTTKPFPLSKLRERIEKEESEKGIFKLTSDEALDWGGCGCATT